MKRIVVIVACMLLLLCTMGDTQGPASDDLDLTRTLITKLGERAAAVDSIEGYRVQRTWRSPAYVEEFRGMGWRRDGKFRLRYSAQRTDWGPRISASRTATGASTSWSQRWCSAASPEPDCTGRRCLR